MQKVIIRSLICAAIFWGESAFAQEANLQSAPIKGDAQELELPSSAAFQPEPKAEAGTWSLKDQLENLPAFFRDTTLKLNLRNFYFSREAATDSPGNDNEKVSWAMGGSAALKTGKLYDVFSVAGEVFTSQKLYGPEDKDGALLLEPGQDGYTILGVANGRFEYQEHLLSLYRQRLDLPYINSQDNRMTPNTFEGYNYAFLGEGTTPPFQFGAGYINKIKTRNSDEFVYMSEAAGVSDAERGMPWMGARFRPIEDLKIVAVNFAGIDFLNIFYSDAEYAYKIDEDWGLKSSLQFAEQRSIGDNLLTGEDVSATAWGALQAISFRKLMLRAAVTVNDKGSSLRSPFGSYPGYNSSIVEDYNRAGEIAWKLGISYDFARFVEGLSGYVDYIKGNRASSDAHEALNDKDETDINFDYRIKEGLLNGFWFRVRSAFVHEDNVGTTKDFRVIVNYDVPIF